MKRLVLLGLTAFGAIALGGCKIVVDDTYTICRDSGDCDSGDVCAFVDIPSATPPTSGNYCTYGCATDSDCESALGHVGACYALGAPPLTNPFICFQTCVVTSDCFSSSVCIEVMETGGLVNRICVPDN